MIHACLPPSRSTTVFLIILCLYDQGIQASQSQDWRRQTTKERNQDLSTAPSMLRTILLPFY